MSCFLVCLPTDKNANDLNASASRRNCIFSPCSFKSAFSIQHIFCFGQRACFCLLDKIQRTMFVDNSIWNPFIPGRWPQSAELVLIPPQTCSGWQITLLLGFCITCIQALPAGLATELSKLDRILGKGKVTARNQVMAQIFSRSSHFYSEATGSSFCSPFAIVHSQKHRSTEAVFHAVNEHAHLGSCYCVCTMQLFADAHWRWVTPRHKTASISRVLSIRPFYF